MENVPQAPKLMQDQWKLAIKFAITLLILILLIIPIELVRNLVNERAERQKAVVNNVASKWGLAQTLAGPYIEVPYKVTTGKDTFTKTTFIRSNEVDIKAILHPSTKKRSIYDVNLYDVDIVIAGNFNGIDWHKLGIPVENLEWDKAKLVVGLTDMRGLNSQATIQWQNQASTIMNHSVKGSQLVKAGLSAAVTMEQMKDQHYLINMRFKGSQQLYFAPNAQQASVVLQSNYPHPSFNGQILPNAEVTKNGFTAKWTALSNHSQLPQAWLEDIYYLTTSSFGVDLITTANHYNKTERVIKYALLFIGLSFGVFFLIETIQHLMMHPINYVLIGIALIIFYSLLLSISEFIGFNKAYIIAALAIVLLTCMYLTAIIPKRSIVAGFGLGLSILYAYVFFIIQLEDLALLFGSIALFMLLAATMYFTRKINWRQLGQVN